MTTISTDFLASSAVVIDGQHGIRLSNSAAVFEALSLSDAAAFATEMLYHSASGQPGASRPGDRLRILLIEDDEMIGKGLVRALDDAGISTDWLRDGTSGSEAMAVGGHELVLLDLGLPGRDGVEVLEMARREGIHTPVLILTARDDLETKVKGLDLGADDFVLKPFELPELLARIRAVLRRHAGRSTSVLDTAEIMLDLASHDVSYRGRSEILPSREFALMRALVERPGAILSRAQLEDRIYGWGEEVESNAVEVLIHYIRKRFDKDIIRNVRGAGWMVTKD